MFDFFIFYNLKLRKYYCIIINCAFYSKQNIGVFTLYIIFFKPNYR